MTMVERMARAILCPEIPARAGGWLALGEARAVVWKMATPTKRANAIRQATAALRELREPTEVMSDAMSESDYSVPWGILATAFTAAIDAAIAEHEGK